MKYFSYAEDLWDDVYSDGPTGIELVIFSAPDDFVESLELIEEFLILNKYKFERKIFLDSGRICHYIDVEKLGSIWNFNTLLSIHCDSFVDFLKSKYGFVQLEVQPFSEMDNRW